MAVQNFHIVEEQDRFKFFGRRANEIGTTSNSAEKKGSPSEGVAKGGGWGEEFRHARAVAKRFRRFALLAEFQPREARQSVGVSFKIGSHIVE